MKGAASVRNRKESGPAGGVFTLTEAAEAVGVHRCTIIRWVELGFVACVRGRNRIRMVSAEDVARLQDPRARAAYDGRWSREKAGPLTEEQRRQVERWLRFSQKVAFEMRSSIPPSDRLQHAAMGLIDAVQGVDPERGLSARYVERHVRSAIKDAERLEGWGAVRVKRARLWSEMSEGERLRFRGVSLESLWVKQRAGPYTPFDPALPVEDGPDLDVEDVVAATPPEAGYVVHRYFRRGRTLKQIGAELGITESAVSLQLKAALAALRGDQRIRETAELMMRPSRRGKAV